MVVSAIRVPLTFPQRKRGGLDAVGQSQLVEDVVQMAANGALGDAQLFGNLAVAVAQRDEAEHFLFAPGEVIGRHSFLGRTGRIGPVDDELHEVGKRRGRDEGLAARDEPDCSNDFVDVADFRNVADGSRADCLVNQVGLVVLDGQDDNLGFRDNLPDRRGRRQSIAVGHANIHKDDVRPKFARQVDRGIAVGCLADDIEVRAVSQQNPQALSYNVVVVDDEYSGPVQHYRTPYLDPYVVNTY